jgi:hypothetical protein
LTPHHIAQCTFNQQFEIKIAFSLIERLVPTRQTTVRVWLQHLNTRTDPHREIGISKQLPSARLVPRRTSQGIDSYYTAILKITIRIPGRPAFAETLSYRPAGNSTTLRQTRLQCTRLHLSKMQLQRMQSTVRPSVAGKYGAIDSDRGRTDQRGKKIREQNSL